MSLLVSEDEQVFNLGNWKENIYNYLENYQEQTKQRFCMLYGLIYESTSRNIYEKLWAKLPYKHHLSDLYD
jgi:hypothetical protein